MDMTCICGHHKTHLHLLRADGTRKCMYDDCDCIYKEGD
jgi:hypothetical protein